MKLTFDEMLFLRDIARMEIANAQENLSRWKACEPIGNITENDIMESIRYHNSRIKNAENCVKKLNQMMMKERQSKARLV